MFTSSPSAWSSSTTSCCGGRLMPIAWYAHLSADTAGASRMGPLNPEATASDTDPATSAPSNRSCNANATGVVHHSEEQPDGAPDNPET